MLRVVTLSGGFTAYSQGRHASAWAKNTLRRVTNPLQNNGSGGGGLPLYSNMQHLNSLILTVLILVNDEGCFC